MDEHPSPWIAAVAREEARKLMAEHERTHHGGAMGELREELRAAAERGCACAEARLLGELWVRSSDELTKRLGADLLQVLDDRAV